MSQDRNRNNSMHPIPGLRDDFYKNGPTPAVFTHDYPNNCLFHNENQQYKVTSRNGVDFDNSNNSIQQYNLKQDQYQKNNFIDNNIKETVKNDSLKHAVVVVDSMDRDFSTYKNSLDFRVKFNPANGEKTPYVDKKIENISYIGISRIIVPNYYILEKTTLDVSNSFATDIKIILNDSNTPNTDVEISSIGAMTNTVIVIWYENVGNEINIDFFDPNDALKHEKVYSAIYNVATNTVTSLNSYTYKSDNPTLNENDRFLFMEIEEFKNISDYSTDNIRGHSFGTLYHDSIKCNNNICYMDSNFSDLTFTDSDLKNISSLTIKFYNSVGDLLDTSLNKNFSVTNISKGNLFDSNGKVRYVSPCKYIRHPLYINSQCHVIFNVAYIEPNINKINFN